MKNNLKTILRILAGVLLAALIGGCLYLNSLIRDVRR